MHAKSCSISLSVLFLIATVFSPAAHADYGEGFIVFRCSKNDQFEMTRRYIWNEELDELYPGIISGKGIVKQKDTTLFNINTLREQVESSCNISNDDIKIRITNLQTYSEGYTLTLFEKGAPAATFITDNASSFWEGEFKLRFSKEKGWEFYCGEKANSTWESLTKEFNGISCAMSRSLTVGLGSENIERSFPTQTHPRTTQQRMRECNVENGNRTGEDRKIYMSNCLKKP